jgi:hypothetical protein
MNGSGNNASSQSGIPSTKATKTTNAEKEGSDGALLLNVRVEAS